MEPDSASNNSTGKSLSSYQVFREKQKAWAKRQKLLQLLRARARLLAKTKLVEFVSHTFPRFERSWHHEVISEYLEKVTRREIGRLMIFAPPRHAKSELISIRWPAWSLGQDCTKQFILITYGDRLSQSLSRAARDTVHGPQYQELWPYALKTESDTKWQIQRPPALDN